MALVEIDTHLRIPKEIAIPNLAFIEELTIEDLSVAKNAEWGFGGKNVKRRYIELYEETETHWILPRGYPIERAVDPAAQGVRIQKRTPSSPTFTGWDVVRQLRPEQVAADTAMAETEGDRLLQLGCGRGKSYLALRHAFRRRKRTIIIVDRDLLIGQWKEEIEEAFGIPAHAVGVVQGTDRNVGKPFTIAMMQTLAQKEFEPEWYDQFDTVIVDEAHVAGAETYAAVVPKFIGERVLLTATPDRKDGLSPVYMWHAGGLTPCYTDVSRKKSSTWYFVRLPRLVTEAQEASCMRRVPGKFIGNRPLMALQRPRFDTIASKSNEWNARILREVQRAADRDRNVIVLGSRTEQLELLTSACVVDGYDAALVTGKVKKAERDKAWDSKILFITDSIGGKALDVPRLDTLFLLSPTDDSGFIRQALGRLDRNDKDPVVVVFVHAYVPSLARKMKKMVEAVQDLDKAAKINFA